MGKSVIADLPVVQSVEATDLVIVETDDGTKQTTVGGLQEAFETIATASKSGHVVTITITDINGTTTETITEPTITVSEKQNGQYTMTVTDSSGTVTRTIVDGMSPSARIVDNGDGTSTITITDISGTTTQTVINSVTVDSAPTSGSNNPVSSGGVYTALQGKQNTLAFDSTPTANSTNPVTSGGVKNALDGKVNTSDTIALAKGGTGATDASGARTNLGLGNVGNFKAVSTEASQGLTSTEQSNARSNLGLGTAATKSSTTSISSGGSGLPTSGTVYNYTRPVIVTSDDTTPPSDTRALWVYPA